MYVTQPGELLFEKIKLNTVFAKKFDFEIHHIYCSKYNKERSSYLFNQNLPPIVIYHQNGIKKN